MAAKRKTPKKATAQKKSIKISLKPTEKRKNLSLPLLNQIWGDDGTTTYGTLNENAIHKQIDDMNMSDLQAHASTVGIIPIDNRQHLEGKAFTRV
jgi:hypothetical protein